MTNLIDKVKNNTKLNKMINKSFNSKFYILFIVLIAILNWKFKSTWIFLVISALCFSIIVLFDLGLEKIFPLVLFSSISFRISGVNEILPALVISFILILPSLIYIFYKSEIKLNKPIIVSMFFILLAMMFSIVNAFDLHTPLVGIMIWLLYMFLFFFIYTINYNSGFNKNNRIELARVFVYLAITILVEIILYYFELRVDNMSIGRFFGGEFIHLGWGNANLVASVFLIIIPMTAYYYSEKGNMLSLIIVFGIELFSLLLLLSRSAYLAFIISVIPLSIMVIKKFSDRLKLFKIVIIVVIVLEIITITYLIPSGIVKEFYNILDSKGLSLEGREAIFNVGLSVFGRYPLFGAGAATGGIYIQVVAREVYYHNFIIETLATIGLFGMIGFINYLYQIIRQSTLSISFNNFVGVAVLSILIQGFFDTTFYNPVVMIILSVILAMLGENDLKLNREEKVV